MCNIEKIGKVRFKTNYSIPKNCKYSNPYCSYNGRCWVLSFNVEVEENQTALNEDLSIGIDLGVKDLATCSNGDLFKNINKTKRIKNLSCGSIKKDLKLKDREYKCDKCGLKIDRDYNASINLSNYSKA